MVGHHLSEEDKKNIFHSVRVDSSGEPIFKDGQIIPDSTNTLIYTIIKTLQTHHSKDSPQLFDLQQKILEIEKTLIPDTPMRETSSKASATITVLQEDILSDSQPEEGEVPLEVGPVKAEFSNWRKPQKLYYPRATHPDVALEEKLNIMKNNYNANNIYEWNIDGSMSRGFTHKSLPSTNRKDTKGSLKKVLRSYLNSSSALSEIGAAFFKKYDGGIPSWCSPPEFGIWVGLG
ncbi:hypothetical protein HAX54_018975 [Datura stramonium]|uniref:Uncharacterized protein n=1 Tax=Datura stramonium TaxID=4076 RepID=A0ABS8UNC2_DATST|nr:hypothetical protein [Datura stramonium]